MFGLCCYTSDTGQAEVAIWNMVRGLSPNHRFGERHRAWSFCPCREKPGICHTTKMASPNLEAEIMLIPFLNQGCGRPSSGFECHLTADVVECIRWIYALSLHINGVTNTIYLHTELWPATGRGLLVTRVWHVMVCFLQHVQTISYRSPVTHICRRVRSHSLMQRERCGW